MSWALALLGAILALNGVWSGMALEQGQSSEPTPPPVDGCVPRGTPCTYVVALRDDADPPRAVIRQLAQQYGLRARVSPGPRQVIADLLPERLDAIAADARVQGVGEVVRDSYLVGLNDTTLAPEQVEQVARQIAQRYGLQDMAIWSYVGSFGATIPPSVYQRVRTDSRVSAITPNYLVYIDGVVPPVCPPS